MPSLTREGWIPCILISLALSLSFSLNCVSCLFSHFPLSCRIILSCGSSLLEKKKKECVYLIECVRAPSEKCAQTLVLGVMLSVLMEV